MDEKAETGYDTYGEWSFYKKHVLSYEFNLMQMYSELKQRIPMNHKAISEELLARKYFLEKLRAFIILLHPKISKTKKPEEYRLLKRFLAQDIESLVQNYQYITALYLKITHLIESLGYSDMSIKKDDSLDMGW